jgi:hypothetical protein
MSALEVDVRRPHFGQIYTWSLMTAGAAIMLVSVFYLPFDRLDSKFVFLCLMVVASSLIAIRIPRVSGRITVADTFIFLGMLMYGGAAAIMLSALEGVAVTLMGISTLHPIKFCDSRHQHIFYLYSVAPHLWPNNRHRF